MTALLRNQSFYQISRIIKQTLLSLRGSSGTRLGTALLSCAAQTALIQGDHQGLERIVGKLRTRHSSPLAVYYLAQCAYLYGDFNRCRTLLEEFLRQQPAHADGAYLLAEACVHSGDRASAWQVMEQIAQISKRRKTWLMMANLVNSVEDYQRLLCSWTEAKAADRAPSFHRTVNGYIALGALRAGDHGAARTIWRDTLLHLASSNSFTAGRFRRETTDGNFSQLAHKTLLDLKHALDAADIPMFLVSGTLLGCIREGKLLPHDKDIDVGVWDDIPREKLLKSVFSSGQFYLLTPRSDGVIRIKHVSGIPVDLFYHTREQDHYWHGGVKMRWWNTPFTLTERDFLGEAFLIPEDYDTYLTENYSDWRTPKIHFDSTYDTPNAEVLQHDELAVYTYKKLMEKMLEKKYARAEDYLQYLDDLGEQAFVSDFRRVCGLLLQRG